MTPAEHEQHVRSLFREEAREHFETIQNALYAADAEPAALKEQLQIALRAAHSLKGAARLTGMLELEGVVHNWESCASVVLSGKLELAPAVFEVLARTLEAAQEELELQYEGSATARRLQPRALFADLSQYFGAHCELRTPSVDATTAGTTASEAKGPTIRVATHKLDRQMASIEELLRLRVAADLRLAELSQLAVGISRWQTALGELRQVMRQKHASRTEFKQVELNRLVNSLDEQWESSQKVASGASALHVETRRVTDALASTADTLRDDVRAVRMVPVADALTPFTRMVRDLGRTTGKHVSLKVEGGDTEVDRDVLESVKDPVMHLLRNSVDHGIETPEERARAGKSRDVELRLCARSRAGTLELEISDDGRGISRKAVEAAALARGLMTAEQLARMDDASVRALIFHDGFSTQNQVSELSGRGVGLAVARSVVEKLGGRIILRSEEGKGTSFTLLLPLTLATSRLLLVTVGKELFALPSAAVDKVIRVELSELTRIDRGLAYDVDGTPVQVFRLADALQLERGEGDTERSFGVVIGGTTGRAICLIDRVLDEQELVARGLGDHLRSIPNVSGVAVLADGRVVPILNSADLLKSAHVLAEAPLPRAQLETKTRARRVLVVDDSVTTRTLEKSILEAAGYAVEVAVDGVEALERMARSRFELVLSDVQMPRLDGLRLCRSLKQDTRFKETPVVLVSSLDSPEQRQAGLDAGADAYLSKQEFEQGLLLSTLDRFLS